MAKIDVKCPICGSIEVSKFGKSKTGKQRYIFLPLTLPLLIFLSELHFYRLA